MPIELEDVFVPGGQPGLTYVSRQDQKIDSDLKRYKYGPKTQILSLTGPTKSGKTVLLKHYFPDAIWLTGGTIVSIDSFWEVLCDRLELFTQRQLQVDTGTGRSASITGGISAGLANGGASASDEATTNRTAMLGRTRSFSGAAREALLESKRMVIIDDFHYIPPNVQVQIVRGIKDLVFDKVPFVVLAVPHRAYDAVKVEEEMTGRVQQLQTGVWTPRDLQSIALQGFQALRASFGKQSILERLVEESFSSPQLMQQFCLNLCLDNELYDNNRTIAAVIDEPEWPRFLAECAAHTSRTAFDRLRTGPRQRSDRKVRWLRNGRSTDMYGVVLAAIQHVGARTALSYEELRAAIKFVLATEEVQPQRHEITRVLEEMTKISREKIEGEPVLDFESENSILHIADPFFAFYIKNANHDLSASN